MKIVRNPLHAFVCATVVVFLASGVSGWSQDAARSGERPTSGQQTSQPSQPAGAQAFALPPASTTRHELVLPGRTLRFGATAGALPIRDQSGRLLAEIAYVAYILDQEPGPSGTRRPVTFAFNGGPGAASAYLNLGMMGPRRLAFGRQGDAPSAPPVLVGNNETWLDFSDLVFIDPAGTGFSRFASGNEEARNTLWSVDGDARSISRVVANWLRLNNRLASPTFLVGESYGGFRAPKVARELQSTDGVGISGLVLISPVLDFTFQRDTRASPLKWVVSLPTMAAVRLERMGQLSRERLLEIESYAAGEYLDDLLKGPRNRQALSRLAGRVSELTGLDRTIVERLAGKVDTGTFLRESGRDKDMVGSPYDGSVTGWDPQPDAAHGRNPDAVLEAMTAPLTSGMLIHYSADLKWQPDGRYFLLNKEVSGRWNYGHGRGDRESMQELRGILALDPNVQVIVAHGYTDLVAPYFESKLLLDQLPAFGNPERVQLKLFQGGHMFYSRDASRAGLREAARAMIERTLHP